MTETLEFTVVEQPKGTATREKGPNPFTQAVLDVHQERTREGGNARASIQTVIQMGQQTEKGNYSGVMRAKRQLAEIGAEHGFTVKSQIVPNKTAKGREDGTATVTIWTTPRIQRGTNGETADAPSPASE